MLRPIEVETVAATPPPSAVVGVATGEMSLTNCTAKIPERPYGDVEQNRQDRLVRESEACAERLERENRDRLLREENEQRWKLERMMRETSPNP